MKPGRQRRRSIFPHWTLVLAVAGLLGTSSGASAHSATATSTSVEDLSALLERIRADQAETRERLADLEEVHGDLLHSSVAETDSEPILRLYGFFEAGLQRKWTKTGGFLHDVSGSEEATFILGDLHLYLDVVPSPSWRALVETRLTVVNGGDSLNTSTGYRPVSTAVLPVNRAELGPGGPMIAATVILERAYLEYVFRDEIGVRLGLWLTPWGIWNVDHGSPTLIPLLEPFFQAYQMFPKHQTGLGLFGKALFLPWTVEYHVGLSNGRIAGPASSIGTTWQSFDLTDDKMVSGRLSFLRSEQDDLQLGLSGYWGRSTSRTKTITGLEPVMFESEITFELEEWGVGADFAYDTDRLRLRLEGTYTQYRYHGMRPPAIWFPGETVADSAQFGGYALVSMPLRRWGVGFEPYLYAEVLWFPPVIAPLDAGVMPSGGFNVDLTPKLRIKFQYSWFRFFNVVGRSDLRSSPDDDAHTAGIRLVVSF